ncbi:NAD-dependent dihydroorotate dehydrogenase B electron transfer subunit [candidate division GN15 bacterium]|nr:NAD-dependent dihydroorotate dehydrogenase B electron transfer subunit [candidate division GN15 bacterium]
MTKFAPVTTRVRRRRHLSGDYYSLTFGPFPKATSCRPGQFVHIRMPESEIYFRRAMSIASVDRENKELEIIFKIFGRGTAALSRYTKDAHLGILGPLGGKFTPPKKNETAVMIGGGIGFPPLLYLADHLVGKGFDPKQILFFYGGRSAGDILERSRIKKLKVDFRPVTEDGSFGQQGLVTEAVRHFVKADPDRKYRFYGCGPEAMLKAVDDLGLELEIPGEVSLEAHMPCGFGVCLGCVVPLRKGGNARVCYEGPVFQIGEVLL